MAPIVTSIEDLHDVCEFSEQGTGEFLYTFFTLIHDEVVYFGRVNVRKDQITLEQYTEALTPIPDNDLFPTHPTPSGEHFTIAPDEDHEEEEEANHNGTSNLNGTATANGTTAPNEAQQHKQMNGEATTNGDKKTESTKSAQGTLYIKRPRFSVYDIYKEEDIYSVLPGLILDEARALEKISRRPHPNVVRYHGCRVRRGRITGLVFDRHPWDLETYVRRPVGRIADVDGFMDGLEAAIRHLHRLGWAHNDVNPSNVLVAERDQRPVLVDFGSTKRIGCKLTTSRGTPGWMEEGDAYLTSEMSHDYFALAKIRAWLQENQI